MIKTSVIVSAASIIIFLITGCGKGEKFNGKFSFYPENPKPGEEITVLYVSDSTNLVSSDSIEMVIHLYSDDLDSTFGTEMIRDGITWKGKFRSSSKHFGALLKFSNDEKIDNNNSEGYFIYFYANSSKPSPGTLAGSAVAISSWGAFYSDLERDRERADELFNEEFKNNPDLEREFISPYLLNLTTLFPEKSDSIYRNLAKKTEKYSDLNEKEINLLITFYGMNDFYDQEKVDAYTNLMKEKFPLGEYVQNDFINKMRMEKDVNKISQMAEDFQSKFSNNKFKTVPFDIAARAYRNIKDFKGVYDYIRLRPDKVSPFLFYSIVSQLLEEKKDLQTALKIAELGVRQNREYLLYDNSLREKYESEKDAIEKKKTALAYSLLGQANVLKEMNKNSEALESYEEMIAIFGRNDPELNEAYAKSLIANARYESALKEIEAFLSSAKHTPPMKEMLKTAYIHTKGSDSGFNSYMAKFVSIAQEMLMSKLKEEMISRPAPNFSLIDLNGKQVSLSDFKGRTVIIDFWATWCGPCLSSFPGLQQAVNKYAEENDVKFLFINSWERVKDKKQNASDFMKKNNYTFHVLMDEKNKVITEYKVSGIPTKFIIDKNQNIRFISVGYTGTPEGLVEELSTMIEMLR
jgi:thiol-disulfide isomerase/thioredoxin/tetratricopeptide (TPR) repeat protein